MSSQLVEIYPHSTVLIVDMSKWWHATVPWFFFANIPSVADPGCISRIPGCLSRIPDPDFYPSRIPDPKTGTKERGENNLLSYLFSSHKFHKIVNYFYFEMLKKKIWANFQRIIEFLTQKIVTKPTKIWVWDPRSGIRKKPIRDPGVKKAPDPGSGSATLNIPYYRTKWHKPVHWAVLWIRIQIGWCPWIRTWIWLRNPDPDPGGKKWPTNIF